ICSTSCKNHAASSSMTVNSLLPYTMIIRLMRACCLFIILICAGNGYAQNADNILLKNYRPHSIYKIPVTKIAKAKFPVIAMHANSYMAKNDQEIKRWIATMDKFGIEKTILFTATSGPSFDSIFHLYAPYLNRFELWCGFDFRDFGKPDWAGKAVKELERC